LLRKEKELLTVERDGKEGADGLGFGVCLANFGWVVGKILREKQFDPNFIIFNTYSIPGLRGRHKH